MVPRVSITASRKSRDHWDLFKIKTPENIIKRDKEKLKLKNVLIEKAIYYSVPAFGWGNRENPPQCEKNKINLQINKKY